MIINEKGIVHAIKDAYRANGYNVLNMDGQVVVYTEDWYIRCDWKRLPRKALATIVEHMGMVPDSTDAVTIRYKEEPQVVMPEIVESDLAGWSEGEATGQATMVPIMFQGMQFYQKPGGGQCYAVDPLGLAIVERGIATFNTAIIVENNRMSWSHENERVILSVQHCGEYWPQGWERDVWIALEGVDLHRKED